ncbi:guanosine pentaphosphate phosphohydrolase [Alishewanella aestuarii B11]|uniref:Guanosine-5'-triphosphate,3'-diphosphate pyrophosphatase n=1 Tax=Alishewanella aestuarii B11 TaxID=1197174 RepID=J1Q0C5_9ALTE|nr:guanosine-5'-triphosphate,3'-diphosphate diphosphatase [Alishewanella aestuarii]EJI84463.1 guanosine pentaphosphate phosphohydrolase [Alishewanella aestuarii B11]OCW98116.1 guanosine-5'-triphosphate,3'-diphosphate pyrophosphatase [Alishewanella sp. HH-ZS]
MATPSPHSDIYAVIDLGSNSFHMLMVKVVGGSVQVIGRVKRKVRLAAGLNDSLVLSHKAMKRGWECLALFAERLQDIPSQNIRIVGTATLRLARNVSSFLTEAEAILGQKVEVISGEDEARIIYLGVAHTSNSDSSRLVIDIGGASTEVVIGQGFSPKQLASLNMGCVTYLERYFSDQQLSEENFLAAIAAAEQQIQPIVSEFRQAGWQLAVGASGTVQAVQEMLVAQGKDEVITLQKLDDILQQVMACGQLQQLNLVGLAQERKQVFPSGLAILIALFRQLDIQGMTLSGGALREGVLYSMLPQLQDANVRHRTVNSLMIRYFIDQQHAQRVAEMALELAAQLQSRWDLQKFEGLSMLRCSALLHELGLLIEYKNHHHHGAYIISHSDLPGFTRAQQQLLMALVHNHRAEIMPEVLARQTMTSVVLAVRLTRILRLAVILSMRRRHEALPQVTINAKAESLELVLPNGWLEQHPLMRAELEQEIQYQQQAGWQLSIN